MAKNFYQYVETRENGLAFKEMVEILKSTVAELNPFLPDENIIISNLSEICLGYPLEMGKDFLIRDRIERRLKEDLTRKQLIAMFHALRHGNDQIDII
jgi:hypothetical protein